MSTLKHKAVADWLLQEGGPVVRWLTLTHLVDQPGKAQIHRAQCDLLAAPHVRLWLGRLETIKRFHNSGNDCFENVAGKLGEFGLHAGMRPLDARMGRFLEWIAHPDRRTERGMMATLNRVIVCAGLLRLGYTQSEAVREFALTRLDQLHRVAAWGRYDIFLDADPPDLPKAFRGRYRVVATEFTPEGVCCLPYICDLYMLAHVPAPWRIEGVRRKIEGIVKYVLTDEYQRLPGGYGYMRDTTHARPRYYVLGWRVQLPSLRRTPADGEFLQRLELMSAFAVARRHRWWRTSMKALERFLTPEGRFRFPRPWLTEKPVGYWVGGAHMGLEENRRSGQAIQVESTLRALRLLRSGRVDRF
jgi:hypothetical protein